MTMITLLCSQVMRRIGEILIGRGALGVTELTAGLDSCRKSGGRIGTQLMRLGFINEVVLLDALSEQFSLPAVSTPELRRSHPEVRNLLPSDISLRVKAVPFDRLGDGVSVGFVDPFAPGAMADVRQYLRARIVPFVATEQGMETTLAELRSEEALRRRQQIGGIGAEESLRTETPIDFLTFERRLLEGSSPQEIGRLLFRLAGAVFEVAAVFSVSKNRIRGWLGAGWGWTPDRLDSISIPEDMGSVFAEASRDDGFSGTIHPSPVNHELADALRFDLADPVDILPFRLRDRVIAYVFGVKIRRYSRVSLADLRAALNFASVALERSLRQRRPGL